MQTQTKLRKHLLMLTQMGVMAAISVVLVYLVHFPIIPSAPFLEYDPADIMLILGAFIYGPVAGLILTAVVCVVQGLTVSANSGFIGIMMHFFATGGYVLVAGLTYKFSKKENINIIIAMLSGIIFMCASMVLWNYIFTPIFMGVPRDSVVKMLVPVIVPFNLIKAGINSFLAFLLFKSVGVYILEFRQD